MTSTTTTPLFGSFGAFVGATRVNTTTNKNKNINGRRRQTTRCASASPQKEASRETTTSSRVLRLFRTPFLSEEACETLVAKVNRKLSESSGNVGSLIGSIKTEQCFNVELKTSSLSAEKMATLEWLLRETYEPELFGEKTSLSGDIAPSVVEVGPRLAFQSAWSTNAVSICNSCGVPEVKRLERSRRFELFRADGTKMENQEVKVLFAKEVHDRMTECVFDEPLMSFSLDATIPEVYEVPILTEGRKALEKVDKELGLAFDDQDFDFYMQLFGEDIKRNPTNVELFDMAQSNSEHSRHWFFSGKLTVDGVPIEKSLFKMVKETIEGAPMHNSSISFKDNSSAIRGYECTPLRPVNAGESTSMQPRKVDYDLLLTAETHNFPSGVAPYPGAETGTGGRIRDTHATGVGSTLVAGTAGYVVGNLQMPGNELPHEDKSFQYPSNLASPLQILIDASNGASDYGNKFGEPVIAGYCRTFGSRLPNGERREYIKPIMFSAGFGQIDHTNLEKQEGDLGMLVVKIGGPAYRIGMGGGAASSKAGGEDEANASLDFNAVQRGDAEMSNKLNRVVKACVELMDKNPILSIHDQGAGGNCNVVKELIYPKGGEINIRAVKLGDETMSVLEIWGAEYQENSAMLIKPESLPIIEKVCARERCPFSVLGSINGSGRVTLKDPLAKPGTVGEFPEDLDLEKVLGDVPKKKFDLKRAPPSVKPLAITDSPKDVLGRVLKLPSVCSKRFLTTKVDRSVTGLIVQQQCAGELQIPVNDCAVISQTHFGKTGGATSIGEAPIKGLIDPRAMARVTLGESLTNLAFANTTGLKDIKYSGNWMYAAKLDGEGAHMYDACDALKDTMIQLGVAIDGGKDSLSMAARAGGEVVKTPGTLVMSSYVTVPDVTKCVTADAKLPGSGKLVLVEYGSKDGSKRRLGASAMAQAYDQVGDDVPDMDDIETFRNAWETTQQLVEDGKISAGHDVSDGGPVVSVLEMAFPSTTAGVDVELPGPDANAALFAEELSVVLEVSPENEQHVLQAYAGKNVTARTIGSVTNDGKVSIKHNSAIVIDDTTANLRDVWEHTSFELEKLQSSNKTVAMEKAGLRNRKAPTWKLTYDLKPTDPAKLSRTNKAKVAIVREEGSNGDREMAAAVYSAGMDPWDVTMSDLLTGKTNLSDFRGLVFVGGFSYADVLDSAKGWAGGIRFNENLKNQFKEFYERKDTFSLGVCNGCQLMALLGFIPSQTGKVAETPDAKQPRFIHNDSGRFESRFVTVGIDSNTPSIMLKDMGGSRMGVWCAHGEGKAHFPDSSVISELSKSGQCAVRYVDSTGKPTTEYPLNPNGSPEGIAGLCSKDGRHLAMMPHPERAFLGWQLPWSPKDANVQDVGPWLKMFQNAADWCDAN
ncbi:unnamed protein product [Bathycoccus prasinos]